ncbi:hypothetical protein AX774_g3387 [Zancudomyces culisetae]|uniref:Histone deacetylase complex subunit SAP30 Sin3 binding domain-containing protein n=1 Tax=Zancudomyces culisetae TaxID=1213189 RepID=A0A1R1PQ72_ZANCU|nr:hypothetical protein AX774_g3387 [Zancudomyces culisetae]|eukprot:OMH83107.1 hypothetical protein AX774_g3387 [Zancudomyces culisetae]
MKPKTSEIALPKPRPMQDTVQLLKPQSSGIVKQSKTQAVFSNKSAQIDFNSFSMPILRKYRQVFKLNVKARSSKDDLATAASKHHSQYAIDEVDTIARFVYTVKSKGKIVYL